MSSPCPAGEEGSIILYILRGTEGLKLAREMELQMLEVLLCHGKYISGICQEDVSSLSITGHILVLAFLEVFQFVLK